MSNGSTLKRGLSWSTCDEQSENVWLRLSPQAECSAGCSVRKLCAVRLAVGGNSVTGVGPPLRMRLIAGAHSNSWLVESDATFEIIFAFIAFVRSVLTEFRLTKSDCFSFLIANQCNHRPVSKDTNISTQDVDTCFRFQSSGFPVLLLLHRCSYRRATFMLSLSLSLSLPAQKWLLRRWSQRRRWLGELSGVSKTMNSRQFRPCPCPTRARENNRRE